MSDLDTLLDFVRFTHEAHRVERVARIPKETRRATMVEHSWQLALLAWYVLETEGLSLDKGKVLQYALVHDLVETYAGDTYFYDEEAIETKGAREHAALEQIAEERPEFPSLAETIATYEQRADAESKFVYALDKLIDPLNIYLEDGLLWREEGVTLAMLLSKKTGKVSTHANVERIFSKLSEKLKEREPELFPPSVDE